MTTQTGVERRRRATVPFLSLAVAVLVVAGLAIGVQSLRTATNGGTSGAAPVPTTATGHGGGNAGIPVSLPLPTPVESSQDCTAIDARSYVPFCGYSNWTRVTPPRAAWLACEVMDETAYRQYCHPGDGGRWIPVPQSPGQ